MGRDTEEGEELMLFFGGFVSINAFVGKGLCLRARSTVPG